MCIRDRGLAEPEGARLVAQRLVTEVETELREARVAGDPERVREAERCVRRARLATEVLDLGAGQGQCELARGRQQGVGLVPTGLEGGRRGHELEDRSGRVGVT